MLRIYVTGLSFFLLFLVFSTTNAQTGGKPAGFIKIDIPANNQRASSLPLIPFNSSIDSLLGSQLTGDISSNTADCITKWDPVTQAYVTVYKCANTGDANKDGKWFLSGTYDASTMTLSPGDGFWIQNKHAQAQTVFLTGTIVLDNSISLNLKNGANLFSYPFTSKMKLNSAKFKDCGAYGAETQDENPSPDVFSKILPETSFWLYSKPDYPNDGKWFDLNNILANEELKIGHSYWYNHDAIGSFDWVETRPYSNPFGTNDNATPRITAVTPAIDGTTVTLTVSCAGTSGESLDVFFKDLTENDIFQTNGDWKIAAANISTNNQTSITWTDNGESAPVAPVVNRTPVSSVYIRIYMVSRHDIDSDNDGLPDAMESFVYGTNPLSSDSDCDGLNDYAEINTHNTNPNKADSDGDGFSDGDEVNIYSTNPDSAVNHPNDTTPPTTPAGLSSRAKSMTLAAFTWNASSDIYGVKEYIVSRDGREIARVNSEQYVDNNLAGNCTYKYTVKAYDYAGNVSAASSELSIATGLSGTVWYVNEKDGDDSYSGNSSSSSKKTIQAAINAASSGNIIKVSDGYYNEALTIDGKNLIITSINGPSKTVIDASNLNTSAVSISNLSSAPLSTVIEGFTLSGGKKATGNGGGITVINSSPVIANCVVKNNSAVNGGGISIEKTETGTASPFIINCDIKSNTASTKGGGIYFGTGTLPFIKQSLVAENTAGTNGGGIYGEE